MPWKPTKRRRCKLTICNELFWPKQEHQLFCSPKHKDEYHNQHPSFRRLQTDFVKLMRQTLKPECFKELNL